MSTGFLAFDCWYDSSGSGKNSEEDRSYGRLFGLFGFCIGWIAESGRRHV